MKKIRVYHIINDTPFVDKFKSKFVSAQIKKSGNGHVFVDDCVTLYAHVEKVVIKKKGKRSKL